MDEESQDRVDEIVERVTEIEERLETIEGDDNEAEYDEMIDECTEDIVIFGMTYSPSRVLKEIDPIAYRCGITDYNDEELSELENELEELEDEQRQLEGDDDDSDITELDVYQSLKSRYFMKLRDYPDDGTCSSGHGTSIIYNGKVIDFWDASRNVQSDSPMYKVEEDLEEDFKKLGLEIRHEFGVMD